MKESNTVLVSGASGYLASHTIIQLLQRGYSVRGTLREPARAGDIRSIVKDHLGTEDNLELVEAELQRPEDWAAAVRGCRYVMHMASPFPLHQPRNASELIRPAVEGTRNIMTAASEAGIKRIVLTSSIASICYGHSRPPDRPFTEEDWTDPSAPGLTPYIRSKALAEAEAWKCAGEKSIDLRVIAPGLILGPLLHPDPATSLELIRELIGGGLPGCPRLGWPIVDVRDLADAHIRALESEKAAGGRFLISNRFMWVREIAAVLRQVCPERRAKIPKREIPDWSVKVFSLFDRKVRSVIFELGQRKEVSVAKAERVLSWQPRPVDETLADATRSLIDLGL